MGAFQREDWVVEGSADAKEVQLALHYTTLAHLFAELRKNKAVFTPHVPGAYAAKGEARGRGHARPCLPA
jgi:hypothetical protein